MKTREAPWSAAAKLPPFHGLDLKLRDVGGSWYYRISLRSLPQPHSKAVAAATALQGALGTVIFMTAGVRPSLLSKLAVASRGEHGFLRARSRIRRQTNDSFSLSPKGARDTSFLDLRGKQVGSTASVGMTPSFPT